LLDSPPLGLKVFKREHKEEKYVTQDSRSAIIGVSKALMTKFPSTIVY